MSWDVVIEQKREGTEVWLMASNLYVKRIKPEMLSEDVLTRYAALTLLPVKHGMRSVTEVEDVGVVHTYPHRTRYRIDISKEEAMRIKPLVDK